MNRWKTTFLLAALTVLIILVGGALGGRSGITAAVIIAAVMNFASYWFSDTIILAMYRAQPIARGAAPELWAALERLAMEFRMPLPRLYFIDLSTPNAFATGRDERHAAVAVTSGLRGLLTPQEIEAVLAHELAHVKNRDILISSVAATLAGALSYLAQMAYWAGLAGGRDRRADSRGGSILIIILAPFIATLLHLAIARSREYLADETGARLSGRARDLASALRKLHAASQRWPLAPSPVHEATAHLFIVNPLAPSFITRLFSTHPPLEERVRRLEAMRPHS